MEPIAAAVGAGNAARQLFAGVVDRWAKAKAANVDAAALTRLLLLEVRRNREILNVAVGAKQALPSAALWGVPSVLQVEVLETVLGQGEVAGKALDKVQRLRVTDSSDHQPGVDFLTNIYVRMAALQGLAVLGKRSELSKVKIELRLKNLREDLSLLIKALRPSRPSA